MQIKDLKPNKKNPRKISDKKLTMLRQSLEKFGDLSGFVFNRQTKTLVSGHQRQKSVPPNAKIVFEVKHDPPTRAFTVAEGYVLIGGERFKYREVDAPPEWETEAMLAANKHGGEWDRDILRLNFADFPNMDLAATGFEVGELKNMGIEIPEIKPIDLTPAVAPQKSKGEETVGGSDEEADAAYLKDNPGPDSALAKENLPSMVNTDPFGKVEEKTKVEGKRFVIIIDCPDQAVKDSLREKLLPEITQAGAKIF